MFHEVGHWFLHAIGADNVSGPEYGFWSGIGVSIFTPITVAFLHLRHNNCHVKGCPWPGHMDPAVHAPACRRHHSLKHLHGKDPHA